MMADRFLSRSQAIEVLESGIIDRIEGLMGASDCPDGLPALKREAERLKRNLDAVDETLFEGLRAEIRSGRCLGAAFKARVQSLLDLAAGSEAGRSRGGLGRNATVGYDALDMLVNGLLSRQDLPEETVAREPEMVFYQKTPARIVFELAEPAGLSRDDFFCDIGSGLGQVPILAHLLTGVPAEGIEFEPAYCAYAGRCAADLNLPRIRFRNADARFADLSRPDVFFMYTPFEGGMLREVFHRLREESRTRRIRLFTYGPCTLEAARLEWLERRSGEEAYTESGRGGDDCFRLGFFESR
jgi:hypothetical protein